MPRAALALAILLLLSAFPLAAAQGWPAPKGETETVTTWGMMTPSGACRAVDPAVRGIAFAAGSYVHTEPDADGSRYAFRLVAPTPEPGCPAMVDLEFESSVVAWPTALGPTTGEVRSACGATGTMVVGTYEPNRYIELDLDVPEACGAGVVGPVYFGIQVYPLHAGPYMACVPYAELLPCLGVEEREEPSPTPCASGHTQGSTSVPLLLYVGRSCSYGEAVYVSAVLGVLYVRADETSCTASVRPFVVHHTTPCPPEVGAVLLAVPWGHVLP